MSFSEAFRKVFFRACLLSFFVVFFTWLVLSYSSDEELSTLGFGAAFVVFVVGVFICGFFMARNKYCPNCKKYLCFEEYECEVLSRDVVSKKVKDNELGGTKLEYYAIGKRKHYYKCNCCGYESTSIKDYKDKIDV